MGVSGAMHPDFFMGQPSFVCEIMPGSIQIGGERGFVGCILDHFVALKFVIAVLVFGLMAGAVVLVFCQLIKPILWLLAEWSGWSLLAVRFPSSDEQPHRALRFQSVKVGSVLHSRSCFIGSNDSHFFLSSHWPFRHCHPPLAIPIEQISIFKMSHRFWGRTTLLINPTLSIRIQVSTRSLRRLFPGFNEGSPFFNARTVMQEQ
jgi:hypothetical protein